MSPHALPLLIADVELIGGPADGQIVRGLYHPRSKAAVIEQPIEGRPGRHAIYDTADATQGKAHYLYDVDAPLPLHP